METDSSLSAIALAISLLVFAIVAVFEASIASIRRERLQILVSHEAPGSATLERLYWLPMGPTGPLSLLKVVALSAAVVSASALVTTLMDMRWLIVALVTLAAVAFLGAVQMAAKALAALYGEHIALKVARPARALAWLLNPVLTLQAGMTQRMLLGRSAGADSTPEMVPTEINLPLESAAEPLDEREVRMIQAVVRLDKTIAREIMVPRVDMVAVEMGTSIADLAEQMVIGTHSRIPAYRGDLDHIEGITYARDVLRHMVQNNETSQIQVDNVIRPALFIPESKSLAELLNEFQQKRVHMAIVVDEYGGVSGLVTIEDLLEEIVGEIQDEFDVGEPQIERVSDNEFLMDARVSIDQLSELFGVPIEGDGFDTLGGLVYQGLGKIPSPGDVVAYDGLQIEVISTAGRRLKRLRVVKTSAQVPEPK